MDTLQEQAVLAKKKFLDKYAPLISNANNNLAAGLGLENNQFTIEARISNTNGKDIIPLTFEGFKVSLKVIGTVSAQ